MTVSLKRIQHFLGIFCFAATLPSCNDADEDRAEMTPAPLRSDDANPAPRRDALECIHSDQAKCRSWDLARDFSSVNSTNSPWLLGYLEEGSFVQFTEHRAIGDGLCEDWCSSQGSIWLSCRSYMDYGILPGNVSLNSDRSTPMVRWTAPFNGAFSIIAELGGTTDWCVDGGGNANAELSGLRVNGVELPATIAIEDGSSNLKVWRIRPTALKQGDTVDTYVGQSYGYGNTNVVLQVFMGAAR